MDTRGSELLSRTLYHLKNLIAIESPSGEEAEVAIYLCEAMKKIGLLSHTQDVGKTKNAIARTRATKETADILLTGHIDTIPILDGWSTDPLVAHIDGERLYGLGSSDQKGGIAAQLAALEMLAQEGVLDKKNLLIAFTADEEAYSDGMLAFLAEKPMANLVLLSEPHFSPATIGWPGKALVRATIHGKAAHGGRPQQGVNAIEEGAELLTALARQEVPVHAALGQHPFVTLSIRGGYERYSLTVPDTCEIVLSKQLVPGESKDTVLALVKEAAKAMKKATGDFPFDRPYYPPAEQNPTNAQIQRLVSTYKEVTGEELALGFGRGVCDGDYLVEAGLPTVSFGPSGGNTHQANEWVSVPQLKTVAQVYYEMCRKAG